MAPRQQPKLLNVNRTPGQPRRRKKITLVFDENKRREFLGGFHKRKLERKKKAREELEKQLKEERKRIKKDAKEQYKKLVSGHSVPELEELLSKKEYETEGHKVSILEVDVADFNKGGLWIGENRGTENDEDEGDDKESDSEKEDNDEVEGMSLKKKQPHVILKQSNTPKTKPIESKKDVKQVVKKAALKQVKQSRAFKQKQRLEQQKNKKESRKKLRNNNKKKTGNKFKKKSSR